MNRSRLRPDRAGRGPRAWRIGQLAFEPLEGRALLSTAHVHAQAQAHASAPQAFYNPVYSITAEISAINDPSGSGNVFQPDLYVDGYAEPYSTVWLALGPRGYFTNVALADYTGHYAFEIQVPRGRNELRLFAENKAFQYSTVTRLDVTNGGPIVAWDAIALRAIRNQSLSGPEAARALAILHLAQYDAVAAVEAPNAADGVHLTAPKGASAVAAADSAANTVLSALFPAQAGAFASAMNQAAFGLKHTASARAGFAVGETVGKATLDSRANDGSRLAGDEAPSDVPGRWRPTPPSFAPAVDPAYGRVTPFALASGSQFRPPSPPMVGSAAFDQALAEVASLGRIDSPTRTPQQTAAVEFWADSPITFTEPGHWNEIAEEAALSRKGTLLQDARLFAMLDVALADAGIAATDAKSAYSTWRPVSAIQAADPGWIPLAVTPASPSYVSDHAAFSAAAAKVLASAVGPKFRFTDRLFAFTGGLRTFPSFAAAAAEDAQSRVWAGVNFSFDVQQGQALGDQVGNYVVAKFPKGK